MSTLRLKQIEVGNVTFTGADDTKTITLSTTLTDTAKTILLFTTRSPSNKPVNFLILGRVLSTTQIQFERSATPDNDATIEYQVIEFTSGITVQHKYFLQTSTTLNTTITAVTTAKAFPIICIRSIGITFYEGNTLIAEITSTTNLQTRAYAIPGGTKASVAVQIVEIDDASVQKISDTYGTGATKDITVTSITESKTFWFFSINATGAVTFAHLPYLAYVDSTTLRFSRASGTQDIPFVVYVVGLSTGISVQNISTVIASGDSTVSPTITSVTTANTALFVDGIYQTYASADEPADDAGSCQTTLSGLSATAFTATRSDTPALAATSNVQVLSFVLNTNKVLVGDSSLVGDSVLVGSESSPLVY